MMRTSDPVRDAEEWVSRKDPRPVWGICPECGKPVYGECDGYYADDAYKIDGEVIHEDCLIKYLKRKGYKI